MPKPFKPRFAHPLPKDAVIVERQGRPHYQTKDERGRPVLYPLTADGTKYLRPSNDWYFRYRDASGRVRRKRGCSDRQATERLITETIRKVERIRLGYADPAEEHLLRPLADHLADFATYLTAKGNVQEHCTATVAKIRAALDGIGAVFLADVNAGRLSSWLCDLRRPGRVPELPQADSFTAKEAAQLLDMDVGSFRRFVARHRLPVIGSGRSRRLPRSTVETVALQRAKGASPETVNHYIRALRSFGAWLVRTRRAAADPFDALQLVNTTGDIRHARRELTADELRQLFVVTKASSRSFRGLSGQDRYLLYLTAAATGFRARALAHLRPADFDLRPPSPWVVLPARFDKSRRGKVQPIPTDVAAVLAEYLQGRPADRPVWGKAFHPVAAEMLRRDLESAGIPYTVEGPNGPEHADFHSLRHTYLTLGGRSGIDLRTLQELAGHSTPTLTARYSHRRLYDLQGAVEKLPSLVPSDVVDVDVTTLQATGTQGEQAVQKAVHAGCIRPHSLASLYTFGHEGPECDESPQVLKMRQPDAILHQVASDGSELPGQDSNLDKESQNLLCYRYTTG